MTSREPIQLRPRFSHSTSQKLFLDLTERLREKSAKHLAMETGIATEDRLVMRAALLVVSDLIAQGWKAEIAKKSVWMDPPARQTDSKMEKARVRAQEVIKRDEQLSRPSVRSFVRSMETKRVHDGQRVSIFNLMRDGETLAASLTELSKHPNFSTAQLRNAIDPYLIFIEGNDKCPFTGLELRDVWRYFRHTWSSQSASVPGRSMLYLVRDAAGENDPIIGIGAISSPVIQLNVRDTWIGWDADSVISRMCEEPSEDFARWANDLVAESLDEVYTQDLFDDRLLTNSLLRIPTAQVISELKETAVEERKKHERFVRARDFKSSSKGGNSEWEIRARSHLFRSKRCATLADLLSIRMQLQRHVPQGTPQELLEMAKDPSGLKALKRLVRKARSRSIGISIGELSVCGALPPYSHLIGGKLVALLALSPEAINAYHCRYLNAVSEISSSLAGREIIRTPHLTFVGTTSLYSVGSSQYNRLHMPAKLLDGSEGEQLGFKLLGKSQSFGTSHFSSDSVNALTELSERRDGGRRINSIFGEGVSPKLRKIRDGLDALGVSSDALLRHGRPRLVYGASLVENLPEYLLGLNEEPRYLMDLSLGSQGSGRIVDWWLDRWVANRIKSEEVIDDVRSHSLSLPINHGARVPVQDGESQQLPLDD